MPVGFAQPSLQRRRAPPRRAGVARRPCHFSVRDSSSFRIALTRSGIGAGRYDSSMDALESRMIEGDCGNEAMTTRDASSENLAAHWEQVYVSRSDADLSWHQAEPAISFNLVREFAMPGARVIDVGGGSSALAGRLAEAGFDVTVLDISPAALARARVRNARWSDRIRWVTGDVTDLNDVGEFDLWHDRAVFHFLTREQDRARYSALAARSVTPGGHLVIGTFAIDGPERCSGLPIERYDTERLSEEFSARFEVRRTFHETHVTPWGKPQPFFFAVLRRTGLAETKE